VPFDVLGFRQPTVLPYPKARFSPISHGQNR